jgi:hypothetical protein
MGANKS